MNTNNATATEINAHASAVLARACALSTSLLQRATMAYDGACSLVVCVQFPGYAEVRVVLDDVASADGRVAREVASLLRAELPIVAMWEEGYRAF